MILRFEGDESSTTSTVVNKCSVAVTVDSNENLATIDWNGRLTSSNVINQYAVRSFNGTGTFTTTCYPKFNATFTSLAPIVPSDADVNLTLPYAYASLHTQVAGEGLQAISIDGETYITNGVWYIKD